MTMVLLLIVSGCHLVEETSTDIQGRAVQYNKDVEQVQNEELLLNIIRASMRRPMEFTGLQSITGAATVHGQLGFSIPLSKGLYGSPNATYLSVPTIFMPNGSISMSPTMTVPVLDTQEFFQGILKPIELKTLDPFFREQYARTLLFNLFVRAITFRQEMGVGKPKRSLVIANYPGDDNQIDAFQLVVEHLLNLGLATEPDKTPEVMAIFTPLELEDLVRVSGAAAGLEIKETSWCDLEPDERRMTLEKFSISARKIHVPGVAHPTDSDALFTLQWICGDKLDPSQKVNTNLRAWLGQNSRPRNLDERSDQLDARFSGLPKILYLSEKARDSFKFCFEPAASPIPAQSDNFLSDRIRFARSIASSDVICSADKPDHSEESLPPSPTASPSPNASPTPVPEQNARGFTGIVLSGMGRQLNSIVPDAKHVETSVNTYHYIDFSQPVDIEFSGRSASDLIYYLGEVTRREIDADPNPDNEEPERSIEINYVHSGETNPQGECLSGRSRARAKKILDHLKNLLEPSQAKCERVLNIERSVSVVNTFVSVWYDGSRYVITADKENQRTNQVMDIATQLLALYKKSKDLPAASVFTLIGP